ncbi:Hypothetical_protein [Hexamita inflata]|uniref:Hypothetical_protein n=1 Tax=Hexamita inflata TaxID=28002 RepID=A0ABP1HMD8_9EUKA
MQLKYNLNSLVITLDSDKPFTNQELESFEPRNVELIEVKGTNQLFNIQVISKYVTDNCTVQINNCNIDLSAIHGTYNKMIIQNCTVTGTVSNQFRVKHLTIQSKCGLKQFSEGNYETIDVIMDQDRLVDLAGSNELNSILNSLQICNLTRIDLGSLEGNWKQAEFKNTSVSGQFTNNFYCTELKYHDLDFGFQIETLVETRPKRVELYCGRYYKTQYEQIANIKHCCVDVTFTSCEIDLNKLRGRFNKLEFDACWFIGTCTKDRLICQSLVFERSYPVNNDVRYIKSEQCTLSRIRRHDGKINQFPDSRQIEVDNSRLAIKYSVNVQNLSLENVEVDFVPISLVNNLVSIKCVGRKNQQIHILERIVVNRNKFASKNIVNNQIIDKIDKDSGLKYQNVTQMEEDVDYFKFLLENVQIGAE